MRLIRTANRVIALRSRGTLATEAPAGRPRHGGARRPRPTWARPGDQQGFALIAVTLVLALLGVVVTELAFSMRLETAMVRSYRDGILARQLAEAGIQQAIREILSDANIHGLGEDGQVVFYQAPQAGAKPKELPRLPRANVSFGSGEFSYRITDEEGRLNINLRQAGMLERLLTALEIDKQERDIILSETARRKAAERAEKDAERAQKAGRDVGGHQAGPHGIHPHVDRAQLVGRVAHQHLQRRLHRPRRGTER